MPAIFNEHDIEPRTSGVLRARGRQYVALWLGSGAILAHAAAWGVIAVANFLADSVSALLFLPLGLVAVAVVTAGLGLGIAAIVVALRARPLATPGAIAVVLGGAGAFVAVLTFFAMVM